MNKQDFRKQYQDVCGSSASIYAIQYRTSVHELLSFLSTHKITAEIQLHTGDLGHKVSIIALGSVAIVSRGDYLVLTTSFKSTLLSVQGERGFWNLYRPRPEATTAQLLKQLAPQINQFESDAQCTVEVAPSADGCVTIKILPKGS